VWSYDNDNRNGQSFTFKKGQTRGELGHFFCAIHSAPQDPELQEGLAAYFKRQKIQNIILDKIRFKLLNDGESESGDAKAASMANMVLKALLNQTQDRPAKGLPGSRKAFASTHPSDLGFRESSRTTSAERASEVSRCRQTSHLVMVM